MTGIVGKKGAPIDRSNVLLRPLASTSPVASSFETFSGRSSAFARELSASRRARPIGLARQEPPRNGQRRGADVFFFNFSRSS